LGVKVRGRETKRERDTHKETERERKSENIKGLNFVSCVERGERARACARAREVH